METPRRYRRAGSSPVPINYGAHTRTYGGSVPLKINLNSSRTARAPPTRRRSAEYRATYHMRDHSQKMSEPYQSEPTVGRPRKGSSQESGDISDAKTEQRRDLVDRMKPLDGSDITALPPMVQTSLFAASVEERPQSPSLFARLSKATSPKSLDNSEMEMTLTPQSIRHGSFEESPLAAKSQRRDSPLESEDTSAQSPSPPFPLSAKPTGKRRRIPTAWIGAEAARTSSLDNARVYCNTATSKDTQFQIPRKPPPIPKTAPKPAPLSLFPTTTASNNSPPGSLRSGSTLIGGETEFEPSTPTTVLSAQKMADAFQASCSPGQHASSGWYDDDDGGERAGLIRRWTSSTGTRQGFGRMKKLVCGCFNSA